MLSRDGSFDKYMPEDEKWRTEQRLRQRKFDKFTETSAAYYYSILEICIALILVCRIAWKSATCWKVTIRPCNSMCQRLFCYKCLQELRSVFLYRVRFYDLFIRPYPRIFHSLPEPFSRRQKKTQFNVRMTPKTSRDFSKLLETWETTSSANEFEVLCSCTAGRTTCEALTRFHKETRPK